MKQKLKLWQLFGFAFTSLLGTVLHFLYDWLGESVWIAPFSGVNESTWEHMKLLFWSMLIFAVIESFFFKDIHKFWCVKLRGILLGLILIPIIFYTYNGVIGNSPDWFNIFIFFLTAALAYLYETKLFLSEKPFPCSKKAALFSILVIAVLFIVFTFKTPTLGIFKDPIFSTYGV